jgi:hypothetical protein
VWFFAWGSSPATRATFDDITIQTTGLLLQPDIWLPVPISGEGGSIEVGVSAVGAQSLKMVGDGTEQVIREQLRIEANTDYILHGRIASIGNSGGRWQLSDTDTGTTPLVATTAQTGDVTFSDEECIVLAEPWNSGNRTTIWLQARVNGSSLTAAFFDAVKLEKGRVASGWSPTYIGTAVGKAQAAAVVDASGIQVDRTMEGIARFRGASGQSIELGEGWEGTGSASDALWKARVTGDTNWRHIMEADGEMQWGSGSAAPDVLLGRGAANRLDLASGDTLRLLLGTLELGSSGDVVLSRPNANELLLAAGDRFRYGFPGVIAHRSATQSITQNVITAIQLNSTDIADAAAFHDTSTNNTRLTIPTGWGGTYLPIGFASMAGHTGVRNIIGFGINGANMADPLQQTYAVISGTGMSLVFMGIPTELAAADYVELMVFQSSAGAVNAGPCYAALVYIGETI